MISRSKRWLFIVAALFLCSKSYGLTLAEVETEVRKHIRDSATSTSLQQYSDTVLDALINQTVREIVNATWCLETTTSQSLSANTTFYSLPSDLIAIKSVRFTDSTGRIRNLTEKSFKATNESNPDWQRQTGPPMNYLVRRSTSDATITQIAYLPIASMSSSLGTAVIDYYQQATSASSDSTVMLNGSTVLLPYHDAIVYGTVVKIKLIEDDATSAATYSQLYTASISAMNSRLGEKPNYAPGLSAGGSGFTGSPPR